MGVRVFFGPFVENDDDACGQLHWATVTRPTAGPRVPVPGSALFTFRAAALRGG